MNRFKRFARSRWGILAEIALKALGIVLLGWFGAYLLVRWFLGL